MDSSDINSIGSKLSDFEEVPNKKNNTNYTILGKGHFGYVEKMKSKINNNFYAIKKLQENKIYQIHFLREVGIMLNLNHENIVKFYGFFKDEENINKYNEIYNIVFDEKKEAQIIYCLILEFIPNGSLNDKIENKKFTPFEEDIIIRYFKQILSAVKYLHENSIIHRDIQPENILFDKNDNIKITDFGLSALYKDNNLKNINKPIFLFSRGTSVGRLDFISPELKKGGDYNFESDVYSVGLLMLCLMSNKYPIQMINNNGGNNFRIINKNAINKKYSHSLKDLVLSMLEEDPKMRKTAKDAYDDLIKIEQSRNNLNPFKKSLSENIKDQSKNNLQNDVNLQDKSNFLLKFPSDEISQNISNLTNNLFYLIIRIMEFLFYSNRDIIIQAMDLDFCLWKTMKITGEKLENSGDVNIFIKSIQEFQDDLSKINEIYKSDKRISTIDLLEEIFKIMNNDFQKNNINWENKIFNNFKESQILPKAYFPYIYEEINRFTQEYKNPFVDNFYFIYLYIIKCKNCKCISLVLPKIRSYIILPGEKIDKISNLINNYVYNASLDKIVECGTCHNIGKNKREFFSSPKFLIIYFEGLKKNGKILEEIIDLTKYIVSNIGPRQYKLFAFISRDHYNDYQLIIRNENDDYWYKYSQVNKRENFNYYPNRTYYPSLAVYKGINF
jgi:serine/threonine protein kinase